jgi:ATP-dependent Clp protease, protease subunit
MQPRNVLKYVSLLLVLSLLPALLCADDELVLEVTPDETVTVTVEEQDPELAAMTKQMEKLELEQKLRDQARQQEMSDVTDQTETIEIKLALQKAQQEESLLEIQQQRTQMETELALLQQTHALAIAELTRETELMQAKMAMAKVEAEMAMADVQAKMAELDASQSLQQKELIDELATTNREKAEFEAETSLLTAKLAHQTAVQTEAMAEMKQEIAEMAVEKEHLSATHALAMAKLALDTEVLAAERMVLETELALREKVLDAQTKASLEIAHPIDPIIDGCLYISDRRIAMPEFVVEGTAKHISDRLNFYNNQSGDAPIFLVMERCYGGSVIEGFRIMQAIESSEAPVYVVVKSFTASMGADILAQAEHSVAYPNARILHHEMSSEVWGSTTEMKEELAEDEEMELRLMKPIAEKMGITVEEFREQMYEHNSNGDWIEYADDAMELKWVNTVVDEIREESIIDEPQGRAPSRYSYLFSFQTDEDGTEYVQLPPLKPHDFYFAHDPSNYYRK